MSDLKAIDGQSKYDGFTEQERIEGINLFGKKAMDGKAAYVANSKWAGDILVSQKNSGLVEHGHWMAWVDANVEQGQQWANEAMRISNYWRANNLTDADLKAIGSKRQLTLMMQSDKEKTAPRSARKPADVVVTTPPKTNNSETPNSSAEGQSDHIADSNEKVDEDPALKPPTNRKTAAGSSKGSEDKKPRTQQVPVEILPEEKTLANFTFAEIIEFLEASSAGDEKTVAKQLRKLADKLDPPDESKPVKVPTASQLRATLDPDTMGEEMAMSVVEWIQYKQSMRKSDWRYQSLKQWASDHKRMLKIATQQSESYVVEAIDKAISKGWRGWEQDHMNGKASGNGSGNHFASKSHEREAANADSFAAIRRAAAASRNQE